MAYKVIKGIMQMDTGSEGNWDLTTEPIPDGLLIYSIDTKTFRLGDGVTLFKDLPDLIRGSKLIDVHNFLQWIPTLSAEHGGKLMIVKSDGTSFDYQTVEIDTTVLRTYLDNQLELKSPNSHTHPDYVDSTTVSTLIDEAKLSEGERTALAYMLLNTISVNAASAYQGPKSLTDTLTDLDQIDNVIGEFSPGQIGSHYLQVNQVDYYVSRASQTSVITVNGLIIIFGGFGLSETESSLLIFNPINGTYDLILSPIPARTGHCMEIISDKVFIYGGNDGVDHLNDLWEFDITDKTFSRRADGPSGRTAATMITYMGDLYLYGGYDGSTTKDAIYRYDVALNEWGTNIGTADSSRRNHVGVVIDNIMYILGGLINSTTYASETQVFNLATKEWETSIDASSLGDIKFHTAAAYNSKVYVYGGTDGTNTFGTLKEWNPNGNIWTSKASDVLRQKHSMVITSDGNLIRYGGYNDALVVQSDVRNYSITNNLWSDIGAIVPGKRARHVVAASSTSAYIHGGYDGTNYLNDLWRYDLDGSYTQLTGTVEYRQYHVSGVIGDYMYMVTGQDENGTYLTDLLRYSIIEGTWSTLSAPVIPVRRQADSVVVGSTWYIAGGTDAGNNLNDTWSYVPGTDTWTQLANLPEKIKQLKLVVDSGKNIYAIGGMTNRAINRFYKYNIASNKWYRMPDMPGAVRAAEAGWFDDKIFVTNGLTNTTATFLVDTWVFDTVTERWSIHKGERLNITEQIIDQINFTSDKNWVNHNDGFTLDAADQLAPDGNYTASTITLVQQADGITGIKHVIAGTPTLEDTNEVMVWLKGSMGGEKLFLSSGTTTSAKATLIELTTEWQEFSTTQEVEDDAASAFLLTGIANNTTSTFDMWRPSSKRVSPDNVDGKYFSNGVTIGDRLLMFGGMSTADEVTFQYRNDLQDVQLRTDLQVTGSVITTAANVEKATLIVSDQDGINLNGKLQIEATRDGINWAATTARSHKIVVDDTVNLRYGTVDFDQMFEEDTIDLDSVTIDDLKGDITTFVVDAPNTYGHFDNVPDTDLTGCQICTESEDVTILHIVGNGTTTNSVKFKGTLPTDTYMVTSISPINTDNDQVSMVNDVDVFDVWGFLPNLAVAAYGFSGTVIRDKGYLFGGYTDGAVVTGNLLEIDMDTATVVDRLTCSNAIASGILTEYEEKLIALGGTSTIVQEYNRTYDTWRWIGDIGQTTISAAGGKIGSTVFIHGGESNPDVLLAYNLIANITSVVEEPCTYVAHGHTAIVDNDRIIFHGGNDTTSSIAATWEYNASTDVWTQKADGPVPRQNHSAALIGSKMIIYGGYNSVADEYLNDIAIYDIDLNVWETNVESGRMPSACTNENANPIDLGGLTKTQTGNGLGVINIISDDTDKLITGNIGHKATAVIELNNSLGDEVMVCTVDGATEAAGNFMIGAYIRGMIGGESVDLNIDDAPATATINPTTDYMWYSHDVAAPSGTGNLEVKVGVGETIRFILNTMEPIVLRAKHVALAYKDTMYTFGGTDGTTVFNHHHKYQYEAVITPSQLGSIVTSLSEVPTSIIGSNVTDLKFLFGNGTSFYTQDDTTWKEVVRQSGGVWQYLDTIWVNTDVNTKERAISLATDHAMNYDSMINARLYNLTYDSIGLIFTEDVSAESIKVVKTTATVLDPGNQLQYRVTIPGDEPVLTGIRMIYE